MTSPVLHLVRHGESTWNVAGRVQGQTMEPELTALGLRQARDVAGWLAGTDAVRLLSSDQRRAWQTAEIIGTATGLTPIPSTMLREMHVGVIQGLPTAEAAIEWERLARLSVDEYGDRLPITDVRMPGGESMRDVHARVGALLATPWITETAGDVILVSHGDTIRIMLVHLLGEDLDDLNWRPVGNGEVHSIHRDAAGRVRHIVTPLGNPDPTSPLDPDPISQEAAAMSTTEQPSAASGARP